LGTALVVNFLIQALRWNSLHGLLRARCGLRNCSVIREVADQGIDYQSGSKHPRTLGCRLIAVVALCLQGTSERILNRQVKSGFQKSVNLF
ncbi:MAG: hypothetical protein ACREAM_07195, partial [Blastocatellia bacterium]